MNKYKQYFLFLFFLLIDLLFLADGATAQIIEEFPEKCAEASIRYPLPGHIIRLGKVSYDGADFQVKNEA